MSIVTLAELQNYLLIPSTEEAKYQTFLDNSEAVVEAFLGFAPSPSPYNEAYYFSESRSKVVLSNSPVLNVYSLSVNGTPLTPTDFYLDKLTGVVTLLSQTCGPFSLAIDYDAGYSPIPSDIKDAIYKLATWDITRLNSSSIGVRTQIVGEGTTTFEIDIPLNIRNQLQRYVKTRLFATRPVETITYGTRP